MHKITRIIAMGAVLCGTVIAQAKTPTSATTNAVLETQAQALVKDHGDRISKLVVLQEFVRDQIREDKTQYG